MQFFVNTRSKQIKIFIETIVPSMIKQLGLTHSRKTLFIKVVRDIDGNDGVTSYLENFDSIVILVRSNKLERLGITLAHEMVHAKQLAKGTLKTINGVNYWSGRRYNKKTKYLDCPWEIEAFSKQELIFRRSIE